MMLPSCLDQLERPQFGELLRQGGLVIINLQLVGGSALFGIGGGIAGFCPGSAISALGLGHSETVIFMAAMITGVVLGCFLKTKAARFAAACYIVGSDWRIRA